MCAQAILFTIVFSRVYRSVHTAHQYVALLLSFSPIFSPDQFNPSRIENKVRFFYCFIFMASAQLSCVDSFNRLAHCTKKKYVPNILAYCVRIMYKLHFECHQNKNKDEMKKKATLATNNMISKIGSHYGI